MVVEACEFRHSFLTLKPRFELVTNIDWDHPDCFPDLNAVITAFRDFIGLLPVDGRLAVWGDDPNALKLGREFGGKLITFGYQPEFDWSATAIEPVEPLGIKADLLYKGKYQNELRLQVSGRHNLQNAMGALVIAMELGVDLGTTLRVLAGFCGVQRRFEIKGHYHGALIVDDYAHHPSAIQLTLRAARQVFKGRIWCVFQPHLYSRTKHLLAEFASAFTDADIFVLADIYPAREKDPGDISSAILAEKAAQYHPDVRYLGGFAEIEEHLRRNISAGDLVITMGAGDIYRMGESLVAG
jgi:UDP-N-acetylmuramate--alanine ligase